MRVFSLLVMLLLTSCAILPDDGERRATYTVVSFYDLEGWQDDRSLDALETFKISCTALKKKRDWAAVCDEAQRVPETDVSARAFFETRFVPYAVSGREGDTGLFTGYYVPELNGSFKKGGKYRTPLFEKPADLLSADLGAFKPEMKGQRLFGKVHKGKFVPYDDRAMIAKGSLSGRAKPVIWVDDPIDAFFLEIQGSGRVLLPNGKYVSLGYAGANGRAYTAIGKIMADRGDISRPVTMAAVRDWLAANPDMAQKTMNHNASYVFFRRYDGADAYGAQGVPLTPLRSLAVDPRHVPMGAPVWLSTTDGRGDVIRRLMVAQDTGGAIKGVVRGDFFWGMGKEAEEQAGSMQSRGRIYVLLPREMSIEDE